MFIGNQDKNDQGFTLIELMVVLFIFGIVAALAAPNFIGMLSRNQVNAALSTLVGAIKETQRQAMLNNTVCRININTSTNKLSGNPGNCLLSNRTIKDGIKIRTNIPGSTPNISFSYRGSTTKMGTIVLSHEYTNKQKCFVISLGTGITRTGEYNGSRTGSVSATKCKRIN